MPQSQFTDLGNIYRAMKEIEKFIPTCFSVGVALTDQLVLFKVTWNGGQTTFDFVFTRQDMENMLQTDAGFEDFFREHLEAAYSLWEVGEI